MEWIQLRGIITVSFISPQLNLSLQQTFNSLLFPEMNLIYQECREKICSLAPSILGLDRGLETPDFRNQRMVIERVQTGGDIKNVFASI